MALRRRSSPRQASSSRRSIGRAWLIRLRRSSGTYPRDTGMRGSGLRPRCAQHWTGRLDRSLPKAAESCRALGNGREHGGTRNRRTGGRAGVMAGSIGVQAMRRGSIEYECQECHAHFSPSPVLAALTPHRLGQKLLTCPNCRTRTWATRFRGTAPEQLSRQRRPGPPVANHRFKRLRPGYPPSAAATPPPHW